jgi:protein-tyrosine-phosphatase
MFLGRGGDLPGAVLFACNRNAVRSPMAAAILKHLAGSRVFVASAGVRAGEATDPFAIAAMEELGIDMSRHKPVSLAGVHDTSFDLIVTLAPEAHHKALEIVGGFAVDVEYWPTQDPSLAGGNREEILDAYRAVRDGLFAKITQGFPLGGAPSV